MRTYRTIPHGKTGADVYKEHNVHPIEVINNGNCWAEHLHNEGMLKDGQNDKELDALCKKVGQGPQFSGYYNDDFWEDFFYRAYELGYKLAV